MRNYYEDYGIGIGSIVIVVCADHEHFMENGIVTDFEEDCKEIWVRLHMNKGMYWFPIEDLKAIETKSK